LASSRTFNWIEPFSSGTWRSNSNSIEQAKLLVHMESVKLSRHVHLNKSSKVYELLDERLGRAAVIFAKEIACMLPFEVQRFPIFDIRQSDTQNVEILTFHKKCWRGDEYSWE
jgi:hypothetical protein